MRQFCGIFMTKLKEYERRHPILIIIWSVLITALLVAGVMVGLSFRHNTAKEDEYIVNVTAIGIFEFIGNVDEETKKDLIQKNSVSIMMPYVRSEISLITAQPGVETVVLPPFNINNMINKGTKEN